MRGTEAVAYQLHNDIAVLTLNRPESRNAIDDAMREALLERLDALEADENVRAVVVTGAGKCFCAGGDIAAMRARLDAPAGQIAFNGFRRQIRTHKAIARIHGFHKPVIAAVNGPAVGLGADLALACDFVLASDSAFFAISYMLRGLIPDGGSLYLLPRRVGLARAKDLIYSGRRVATEEALRIGLADRSAAPEALMETALGWAHELSRGSLTAMALGKTILNESYETGLEEIFELGGRSQAICYSSAEHRSAVEAFLAKD
ncbi:enoyl-CoA hydratase/isomerase family protein [Paracoccus aminovorans]|uniref:enoyl-CoA hydratase/isomerase family protein n=1 Tax=Paracoccus aminovorans TaxID=34004 RepID=UPI00078360EB|nr:enoyl-CoA hydratase/isomerase family protein [Paracoccus aminovorans]MDQ7777031.1 enoyl-CoA hydratase/isomerase family protein [Paracoccus aminovorans]